MLKTLENDTGNPFCWTEIWMPAKVTIAYTLNIFKTASYCRLIYFCTTENEDDNLEIL